MSATRTENRRQNSEHIGASKTPTKTRKTTVEECRRVRAAEAPHVGATTAETQIGDTSARRLWAVCPKCERRVCFLYQRPDARQWACRTCHQLTTRAQQQKGTKAAFEQWLTMDRWGRMVEKHPAMAEFYKAIHDDWEEKVAPFHLDRISAERRAKLLEFYANDAAIERAFEDARWHWSGRMEEMNAQVGERIHNDIWRYWKWLNRSRSH